MGWIILLLVIAGPVIEIATFIQVADWIGILETVGLAVIAGIAGLALLRAQGVATLLRAREALQRGEQPVAEIIDGILLAGAGFLLLLPGLVSDVAALLLLLPPVRALLRRMLARNVRTAPPRPGIIEGDFEVIREDEGRTPPPEDRRLR
jgi:UPF0716 protein FxsA